MSGHADTKLSTAVLAVFLIAVVSLVMLAIASSRSLDHYRQDTQWVKLTYDNVEKLNGLMAQAERATSINRAFLITGDVKLLTKRDQTLKVLSDTIQDLQNLTADNPLQQQRMKELGAMLDDKAADMDVLAGLRIKQGFKAVEQEIIKSPVRGLMDNVRAKVGEIEKSERDLLTSRIEQSHFSAHQTQRFIIFTTIFSIVLMAVAFVAVRRGLAERDRANLAMNEAKTFAEGIVETVREPILVLDPNLTVLAANRSFHLLFQTTNEEIAGMALHRLGNGILDIASLRQLLQQSFEQSNEFRDFELIHDFPGLGRRVFLLNGRKIVHASASRNDTVLLAFDDVTEHRRREEEVRKLNDDLRARASALERSNTELDTFNYSVSHDLRAPLRAISGFSEIISRRHRKSLSEEAGHYFDNIVSASVRMGRLIDDLLSYSKLGKASIRLQPLNLRHTLAMLLPEFDSRINSQNGSIQIEGDLPFVLADETFVQQIFTNLIENAITYQKPNSSPQITIRGHAEGNWAFVEFEDNGIGIAPEHQEKIFHIFQRLHNEEQYPGTGLGLAIVKKTISLMGGTISVRSTVNLGSTFTIKLPLALEANPVLS